MPIIGKPLLVLGSLAGVSLLGTGGYFGFSHLASLNSQQSTDPNSTTLPSEDQGVTDGLSGADGEEATRGTDTPGSVPQETQTVLPVQSPTTDTTTRGEDTLETKTSQSIENADQPESGVNERDNQQSVGTVGEDGSVSSGSLANPQGTEEPSTLLASSESGEQLSQTQSSDVAKVQSEPEQKAQVHEVSGEHGDTKGVVSREETTPPRVQESGISGEQTRQSQEVSGAEVGATTITAAGGEGQAS